MKEYEQTLSYEANANVVSERSCEYTLAVTKNSYESVRIVTPADAADYARKFYGDDISIYESAFIILLNHAMRTIGWVKIGQGGISSTMVDVKLVAKYAIESLASYVILVHNHPSGTLSPSKQDDILATRIKDGLKLLDISLRDNIILAPETGFYSYVDNSRL